MKIKPKEGKREQEVKDSINQDSRFFFFFFFAVLGLRCCAQASLRCGVWASHCGGFSCCRARALGAWASVVVACGLSSCGSWALEHRPSSCGAWAQLLHSMRDLPGPGMEPVSPALAGGFSTTALPGKPNITTLNVYAPNNRAPKYQKQKLIEPQDQ